MGQKYRQFVILVSLATCLFYLTYRLLFTLNLTTPYAIFVSIFLFLGEFYGVFVLSLFFLQVWDTRQPPPPPVLENRTVDVFVPTYNEDPQLLRMTLEACSRITYPHKTYLCDDGGTEARLKDPEKGPAAYERAQILKKMCAELGAIYMPRPDNRHAKAGNLNHAFEKTDGEFIIILDADHVPEPHFISRLIGYFADEKLGFVQTPHAFYNFDNFQARHDYKNRSYWEEGHLFYEVIQPGRNRWNCPIFAGSAAMFRRKALKEVGYIATETITEDMHTGMRVNSRGWKSKAISDRLVAGQAAPDVTTFHSQRIRWGEGNLSIMAHDNPLTMKGLSLAQRFCYLGSMVHWAGGLFKLAVYITPLLMMFTGVSPVSEFTWTLASITLFYLIFSIYGVRVASNGFGSFINGELFCMINFWTQIQGTMKALFWRKFQKFVVTSKRGRQAKTIWPYIRPQVYLLLISVVAIFWGWYKILVGISDDYFRPIIPTFWILFHMALALAVLRRALWPEDRRFSTRLAVHLPVSYQAQDVDVDGNRLEGEPSSGLGITADLNEMGVGLVTYEPLKVGSLVRLCLRWAGDKVDCLGEVRWTQDQSPPGKGDAAPRGFRHGLSFKDLTPQQTDAINRMTLHYAVPRLYSEYAQGRERTLGRRLRTWLAQGLVRRREAARRIARLPVFLKPQVDNTPQLLRADLSPRRQQGETSPQRPQGGAPQQGVAPSLALRAGGSRCTGAYSVTEDVSRTAMSVLLSEPLEPGTIVDFVLATPLGEVRGEARVLRGEPRCYAARPYQLCVLEFLSFAEQGRVTLEMVLNPRGFPQLGRVLDPERKTLPIPVRRPLAMGLAAACALVLAALGSFHFLYRDDLFLRDIALAERPISEEELERVEAIFNSTLQQGYPSTDRLVLLMGAMARVNHPRQIDQVTMMLAPRDRRNLDLQFALAQILDNNKDYARSEEEFQRLLQKADDGSLPASRRHELLLGAARASAHAGDLNRASERYHQLLKENPGDHTLRNEFAGVLMGAHKFPEAARLYEGLTPDLNGRLLLVAIHTQTGDFAAAERECRTLIRLRPDDPQAKLLLADVLSWKKGGHRQSRAIYEQLLKVNAGNLDLLTRLAQIALWDKHYDEALERFQGLIERRLNDREIVKGYVDAAASADKVGEAQRQTALAIYERTLTDTGADDVVFLTRLAWVLQRVKEADKATVLLDRALELKPQDPATRRQVIGSLLATGRFADKIEEFEGKELDFDTRLVLVHTYVGHKNFDAAAAQCRRMLKLRPDDPKTLRLLADILSWNKKYKESLELLGRLAKVAPDDPEVPLRQAEVTLWSGDCDGALARYHALLEAKFEQPPAWAGYAAAAAGAKRLTDDHRRMLLRIYDGTAATDVRDAVFLARLAWALQRLHETDQGRILLDRAVALKPTDPAARKELAGVLAAAGKGREALAMYEGLPLTLEDRYRLAGLYAAAGEFATAADQCRAFLKEKPGDRQARRQLADVLSWKKDYPEALALLNELAKENPLDAELRLRLAEVTLWSGAHDEALARYQTLLKARFEQPALWAGYVDAAASASKLSESQGALALRIADRADKDTAAKPLFLARLAWVMHRLKEPDRSTVLLDRAVALDPKEPAARKELAGVLAATGRNQEALRLYEGVPLDRADRLRLADLHAAAKDFSAAEQQLQAVLKEKPNDPDALRKLADVLSWNKKFREALPILTKLAKAHPQDAVLAARLAEVTLWSGDQDGALTRYEALLETDFNQPALWPGFVDAAASATKLSEAQAALALRLADQAAKDLPAKPLFLARLAWVMHRLKEPARAAALLDRALTPKPTDPAARRELAGVLAAVGKNREALAMYQGVPLDLEDRYRLAGLYVAAKDLTAAEDQCRIILKERPNDHKTLRLLAAVLSWKKEYTEALALLKRLSDADPADAELPVRLAEVLVWKGDYDQALPRLQALLEARFDQPDLWRTFVDAAANAPRLTSAQAALALRIYERAAAGKSEDVAFLARLAWLLHRAKQPAKAVALLDRAVALKPTDMGLRRELAGTLAAVGKFQEALRMYEGVKLDAEDRYHLIGVYATALKQSRDLLDEKPNDAEAKRLSAYVLGWKKVIDESLAFFDKLADESPRDDRLQVRRAEVTLWSGNFDRALGFFQALLEEQFDRPELWRSYIDAAASATRPFTEAHRRLALRLYDRRPVLETKPEYLSRLAWILFRLKDKVRTNRLLDRALALKPEEPAVRRELAGVLAAAGRYKEARGLYAGLKLTLADRYRLAEIDNACGEFDAAEKEVREILKVRPDDLRARLLLASVLTGRKEFGEAAKIYQELRRDHPDDPTLRARLAELSLWGGDYDTALAEFQKLLDREADQPALWKGYIDAASSAKTVPASARKTVVHIYEKVRGDEAGDAVFLTRLAWVLRRVKELDKSVVVLRKALELDPKSRTVRLRLAETLYEAGDYDGADKQFKALLKK